jgi:hypothetical protein
MRKSILIKISDIASMSDEELVSHLRGKCKEATTKKEHKAYYPSSRDVYDYLLRIDEGCYRGVAMLNHLKRYHVPTWLEEISKKEALSASDKKAMNKYNSLVNSCNQYLQRKKDWANIKSSVTRLIMESNEGLCYYCLTEKATCIDHKTPLVRGGDSRMSNLAPSCRTCNAKKHDLTVEEFLKSGRI